MKELTPQEADEFIINRVVETCIKGDVTGLVEELELFYGDSIVNGIMGENLVISNCPKDYYGNYENYEEASDLFGSKHKPVVCKWYIVDELFAELLAERGEIVVLEANLWGCQDEVDDPRETNAIKEFLNRMQILYGQTNAIIKDLKQE